MSSHDGGMIILTYVGRYYPDELCLKLINERVTLGRLSCWRSAERVSAITAMSAGHVCGHLSRPGQGALLITDHHMDT